jgi:hypothetical protein
MRFVPRTPGVGLIRDLSESKHVQDLQLTVNIIILLILLSCQKVLFMLSSYRPQHCSEDHHAVFRVEWSPFSFSKDKRLDRMRG